MRIKVKPEIVTYFDNNGKLCTDVIFKLSSMFNFTIDCEKEYIINIENEEYELKNKTSMFEEKDEIADDYLKNMDTEDNVQIEYLYCAINNICKALQEIYDKIKNK